MKLTDILSLEKWVALEEQFHKRSGLDCNVFDTDGIRITDYKKWVNRLCPVIKDNDKGQSFICAVAHMNIATQARQTRSIIIEKCDAGLIKMVVPIFVEDKFVGAVGACGLLANEGEVDTFMINKTIGMEEDAVENLSNDISNINNETLESFGEYVRQEIDRIIIEMR